MKPPVSVILVTLFALTTPAGAQTGSNNSTVDSALEPWLPATLAITFHTALAAANVYCIAKRGCGSFRYVGIALGYGIGALDGLVGALNLARDETHEDRVVGYTALGLAAVNIGLGLWNHLTPQRSSIEKRVRLAPTVTRPVSEGSGPGLLLSRRF